MSDHPKEAERNLKRIRICDDICFDVFRLLTPKKVGLQLALVSRRFDALVDAHFRCRKWSLGKMQIHSSKQLLSGDDFGPFDALPFDPQMPLPNSVVGFIYVHICSLNSNAIAFLQRIARLLQSDVSLGLFIDKESEWNRFATSVWPLLNVSGIVKLFCSFSSDFSNFRRLASSSVLRDCTNLRFVMGHELSVQFPPNDAEGSTDGQAICQWVHMPRADGLPKVLKCGYQKREFPVDELKTFFSNANTAVSFIIVWNFCPSFDEITEVINSMGPFELVNASTREQLTTRQIGEVTFHEDLWLIVRSPIDKNAKQWDEWERQAMEIFTDDNNMWKVLSICI